MSREDSVHILYSKLHQVLVQFPRGVFIINENELILDSDWTDVYASCVRFQEAVTSVDCLSTEISLEIMNTPNNEKYEKLSHISDLSSVHNATLGPQVFIQYWLYLEQPRANVHARYFRPPYNSTLASHSYLQMLVRAHNTIFARDTSVVRIWYADPRRFM